MDEVGRGTTPKDGLAVAYACLYHLYHTNQCRVLFATHFHDLTDLAKSFEGVGCYCTDIIEDEESFAFDHRVRPGVNRNSHALKVARLAGLSSLCFFYILFYLPIVKVEYSGLSITPLHFLHLLSLPLFCRGKNPGTDGLVYY